MERPDQIGPSDRKDRSVRNAVVSASGNADSSRIAELAALYETAPVGLAFLDTDLRYVRVNETLAEMSGVPAAQVIGRSLREVLPAALADRVELLYRSVLATGEPTPRTRVTGTTRARPNEERAWLVSPHPVRDSGGVLIGVQTVVLDVTEVEQAERSRDESEQRFRLLVEAIQDYAIYGLDPRGRVATWNAGAEGMTGYTAADVMGRSLALFYTPRDRAAGKPEHDLAQAQSDGRFSDEGWYARKDGTPFYANVVITSIYDAKGTHQGFAIVTRDATERKRSEEERRHILTSARCLLWSAEVRELSEAGLADCTTWFPDPEAAERFLPIPREPGRAFFRDWYRARLPEDSDACSRRGVEALTAGHDYSQEFRIRLADGSLRWIHEDVKVQEIEPGRHWHLVGVCTDVTERKSAEEEMRQLHAEVQARSLTLETANRIALDILSQESGVDALRHIAEAARTLAGARYAAIGVARPDGEGLEEFITTGLTEQQEAAIGTRPTGHGLLGLLLARTDPLRLPVIAEHPASVGFPPNHPPMTAFLGVPIRRGETILGSLYLTDKEGGDGFTAVDEASVQALGAHTAVAIHHLRLVRRQRALLSGLINAQEEERRAVAYDLHDGLTQYVMAAHAHMEAFRDLHAAPGGAADATARAEFARGLQYLKEAVLESRRLVNGLRALALDDLGLAGALEQLLSEEKIRARWQEAYLAHNIAGRRFEGALETTVYRVAQEALTNARRHAAAQRVRVSLIYDDDGQAGAGPAEKDAASGPCRLILEVRDWGRGFITRETGGAGPHGFGLQGMIERIHLLGGTPEIRSVPGAGTTIRAVFPVAGPPLSEKGKLS
jgi:PAS domain S-box-containing protein